MHDRERILERAVRIYAEYGFRGATTRKLAREAGINEVTLFRMFGSKGALIEEAVRHHVQSMVVASLPNEPADPEKELTKWCRAQITHLCKSRDLIRTFMCDLHQYPEMLEHVRSAPAFLPSALPDYIGRLQALDAIDNDIDIRAAMQMLRGALFSDAMGRDIHPENFPPQRKAAALYAQLFLRAIGLRVERLGNSREKASGRSPQSPARTRR